MTPPNLNVASPFVLPSTFSKSVRARYGTRQTRHVWVCRSVESLSTVIAGQLEFKQKIEVGALNPHPLRKDRLSSFSGNSGFTVLDRMLLRILIWDVCRFRATIGRINWLLERLHYLSTGSGYAPVDSLVDKSRTKGKPHGCSRFICPLTPAGRLTCLCLAWSSPACKA